MKTLAIDLETYSSIDLTQCGVYAYTEAKDFEILLFGYAFDDDPVQVIDFAKGEDLPPEVLFALIDPAIIKTAFNANFEITCLSKYFSGISAKQWQCTAVLAATLGLPHRLEGVAKVLKLQQQKDTIGKSLIRFFSVPCQPRKANLFEKATNRNLPENNPEKWELFKKYCAQDVEVEREIRRKLERFLILEEEHKIWQLDQKINDTGVKVDKVLVSKAIECDTAYQQRLEKEAVQLTGLDNPKSVFQLKSWLLEAEGLKVESLNKETVPELLRETESETVQRVLELRKEMAKTSVKKYQKMETTLCKDDRIRGLFQFYGANRTGRWAGRLVQVQNLPQNKLKDLDLARKLLRTGQYDALELLFESVPNVLSQLIRTAFIPSEGCKFIVADFSAIEARVIAWLAGEKWRLDVFNSHGKIYEASASQMFKVPIESITKTSPLRQKGKIAELALGYQGAKGALITMGALKMGLEESELPELVTSWRQANPNIVQLWYDVENTALTAIEGKTSISMQYGLTFSYESGFLFISLPSGRRLAYVRPLIEMEEKFNKPGITYEGMDQTTKQWTRLKTYGGKLVENIVQAIARDCLRDSMLRLDAAGYKIVMHVHDEVVLDTPIDASLEEVCEIMGQPLSWSPGLPLKADGYETDYYKKD